MASKWDIPAWQTMPDLTYNPQVSGMAELLGDTNPPQMTAAEWEAQQRAAAAERAAGRVARHAKGDERSARKFRHEVAQILNARMEGWSVELRVLALTELEDWCEEQLAELSGADQTPAEGS